MNPRFPIVRVTKLTGPDAPRLRGLGDVVAIVAKPVARTIDVMFKTQFENCVGCSDRREKLNSLLRFK